jgi:hypothetical protein
VCRRVLRWLSGWINHAALRAHVQFYVLKQTDADDNQDKKYQYDSTMCIAKNQIDAATRKQQQQHGFTDDFPYHAADVARLCRRQFIRSIGPGFSCALSVVKPELMNVSSAAILLNLSLVVVRDAVQAKRNKSQCRI